MRVGMVLPLLSLLLFCLGAAQECSSSSEACHTADTSLLQSRSYAPAHKASSQPKIPKCQENARRQLSSPHYCKAYEPWVQNPAGCSEAHGKVGPPSEDFDTQCSSPEMCGIISSTPDEPTICSIDGRETVLTVAGREFNFTLPEPGSGGGCTKPEEGWPAVFFSGFIQPMNSEITDLKQQLLSSGIAWLQTTLRARDTASNRYCNSFENVYSLTSKPPNFFDCVNLNGTGKDGKQIASIDLEYWKELAVELDKLGASKSVDVNKLALLGWSVGAQTTSLLTQFAFSNSRGWAVPFPKPKCLVMISGGSYFCYQSPRKEKCPGCYEDSTGYTANNCWFQGWANQGGLTRAAKKKKCSKADSGFPTGWLSKEGVCPGWTAYDNDATAPEKGWWEPDWSKQHADDVLKTEEVFDSCALSMKEHPPVLLEAPYQDTYAYPLATDNYFAAMAANSGGKACKVRAGRDLHGPAPCGTPASFNFIYHYLKGQEAQA